MQMRPKLIESPPQFIAESVKPIENIDGIKIIQVDGLSRNGVQGAEVSNGDGSLANQVVSSAPKYRTQVPRPKEIGLEDGDINGLTSNLAAITLSPQPLGRAARKTDRAPELFRDMSAAPLEAYLCYFVGFARPTHGSPPIHVTNPLAEAG